MPMKDGAGEGGSGQGPKGGTRLDRLLKLLEAGTTPATRQMAAEQIGELAAAHRSQLPSILRRVRRHLTSTVWETRIAASQAIGAIASLVKHVSVHELAPSSTMHDEDNKMMGKGGIGLTFDTFDIAQVLEYGAPLLASKGQEYDVADSNLSRAERLQKQREKLRKQLGLDEDASALTEVVDIKSIVQDEDLIANDIVVKPSDALKKDMSVVMDEMDDSSATKLEHTMSARERNRLKRKAKNSSRGLKRAREEDQTSGLCASGTLHEQQGRQLPDDDEEEAQEIETGMWPFQWMCDDLTHDIFSASWEVRHGATAALREILRFHALSAAVVGVGAGGGPGSSLGMTQAEAEAANTAWLQDCAIRLLCMFALDRFGDYVSDTVVAPVRETCAQALGMALKPLPLHIHTMALHVLLQLRERPEWEVRHSAMLGIKYLLVVRPEHAKALYMEVLPAALLALRDKDDDVRGAAADALLPMVDALAEASSADSGSSSVVKKEDDNDDQQHTLLQRQHAHALFTTLWDLLLDLDELSPSTASVMRLLAELYSRRAGLRGEGGAHSTATIVKRLPRLWAFLRHNISSVRMSAACTIQQLALVLESAWPVGVLRDALRVVFQSLLVEEKDDIAACFQSVWCLLITRCSGETVAEAAAPWVGSWCGLTATPAASALSEQAVLHPTYARQCDDAPPAAHSKLVLLSGDAATRARQRATSALGLLGSVWPEGMDVTPLHQPLQSMLEASTALHRHMAAEITQRWVSPEMACQLAVAQRAPTPPPAALLTQTVALLTAPMPQYAELAPMHTRLKSELVQLMKLSEHHNLLFSTNSKAIQQSSETSLDVAIALATEVSNIIATTAVPQAVSNARDAVLLTAGAIRLSEAQLHDGVLSMAAGAAVASGNVPAKLNPLIRPLMNAVQRHQHPSVQRSAAKTLAKLIQVCSERKTSPVDKIVGNLVKLLCADPTHTPEVKQGSDQTWPPPPPADDDDVAPTVAAIGRAQEDGEADETLAEGALARMGAEYAMEALATRFGPELLVKIPKLWQVMSDGLALGGVAATDLATALVQTKSMVESMQVVRTLSGHVAGEARCQLASLTAAICSATCHPHPAARIAAAHALTALIRAMPDEAAPTVLRLVQPAMSDLSRPAARCGAMTTFAALISDQPPQLVPYAVLLLVPLMGAMSDPLRGIRVAAAQSFAALVPILPLARGLPTPSSLDPELVAKSAEDGHFLEQLLDNSKVDDYEVPVKLTHTLRRYQQEGVNWLAFLRRFHLHGILCDDMGLGKTIQSTAIIASTHMEQLQEFKQGAGPAPLPSLVVCPPTLVAHWEDEVSKYLEKDQQLKVLQYVGMPNVRRKLIKSIPKFDLVVMSYETLRSDIDALSAQRWCYCVLDEGHVVKNSKTKLAQAVKSVQAKHRLLLSGTPLQNNVLELWSLFDFLMPGFLGTEREFFSSYGKSLQQSTALKASVKKQEAGMFALEGLHKKVMPFLLRRTKDQVLKELPPKIIQDVYCELSPLQTWLYHNFEKSQAATEVTSLIVGSGEVAEAAPKHVFQALQYLRKLCSHPLMALEAEQNPAEAAKSIAAFRAEHQPGSLKASRADHVQWAQNIEHAPKLVVLQQILEDCGIGLRTGDGEGDSAGEACLEGGSSSGHRVLVFAQLKGMLDLVERDLFQGAMRDGVSYLRLDGSVDAAARFDIVRRFNRDPTVDVLLLTTHVGGLGLNLTSADTVVFLEHDWNPQKDLQAMDRAHRLGQKRTVNVFRILTRDTLEEKIMSLQRFKLDIANAVVNQDNMSLQSMDTGQLLNLFHVGSKAKVASSTQTEGGGSGIALGLGGPATKGKQPSGLKAMLHSLEDLWEETQYSEEFALEGFIDKLR